MDGTRSDQFFTRPGSHHQRPAPELAVGCHNHGQLQIGQVAVATGLTGLELSSHVVFDRCFDPAHDRLPNHRRSPAGHVRMPSGLALG